MRVAGRCVLDGGGWEVCVVFWLAIGGGKAWHFTISLSPFFQGYDSNRKQLVISTCSNQDPLKATTGKPFPPPSFLPSFFLPPSTSLSLGSPSLFSLFLPLPFLSILLFFLVPPSIFLPLIPISSLPLTPLRPDPSPWHRCVGACLLPPVSQCASRLCQGCLECGELGRCGPEVQRCLWRRKLMGNMKERREGGREGRK